ncbi:ComF family protein [Leucobacter massiliensis]|nr:phosphoribosyltransferase family protein [Leucobacter massiliensis]
MSSLSLLREFGQDLLALLWPTACVCCGAPDRDCCLPCLVELRRPGDPVRPELGIPCFVRGPYSGALRSMLLAFKHGGRAGFARHLGPELRKPLLAALGCCSGPAPPVIVAAPSRRARTRRLGYAHVEVLLDRAVRGRGRSPGRPGSAAPSGEPRVAALRVRALRVTRGRRSQQGLDAAGRAENAGRVAVRASRRAVLRGREVILVDDVITTGATALAARDALAAAGARVVAVVALCAVERDDTRGPLTENPPVESRSPGGVEFPKGVTVRHTGSPA